MNVRLAQPADMGAFADIVNHYIESTAINFRQHRQHPSDWLAEYAIHSERYPWLVAEVAGRTDGIAYATRWNERTAYGWAVEVTGYVRTGTAGRGLGTALYGRLLELLDTQGYTTAIAVIALPNEASVAFHERFGFRHVGTFDSIGFKFDRWHDVGLWQRRREAGARPPELMSVDAAEAVLDVRG